MVEQFLLLAGLKPGMSLKVPGMDGWAMMLEDWRGVENLNVYRTVPFCRLAGVALLRQPGCLREGAWQAKVVPDVVKTNNGDWLVLGDPTEDWMGGRVTVLAARSRSRVTVEDLGVTRGQLAGAFEFSPRLFRVIG